MSARAWYGNVLIACMLFFVLTIAAMVFYPGGRIGDAESTGYAFFTNFFSDLGQTETHSGAANHTSLVLFCCAMGCVAFGMAAFFITFTHAFAAAPGWTRMLAGIAAVAGCISALCFLGVALTPWNLYLAAHNTVTKLAFQTFLPAVVCDIAAVIGARSVSRAFAVVFSVFALVLVAYIALIVFGPPLATAEGARIQATGQKLIVYASVLTIFVQALLARRFDRSEVGTYGV